MENRYFSNGGRSFCDIWSSLGSPWPDYWWVSHAASVNLWLMTCTCTPCNQTLFKQSVSETEDSERLETAIISPQRAPSLFFRDHLSARQAGVWGLCLLYWISNRAFKQKTVTGCTACTSFQKPEAWHRGPVYSARGTLMAPQSKSPSLWTCLLQIPHKCVTWNCDCRLAESLGFRQCLLCVRGLHRATGLTPAQLESFSDSWKARGTAR